MAQEKAYLVLEECYREKKKVLIAGNGGSAADAEHIVGELMKGFKLPRKPDMGFASKLIEKDEELGRVLAENLQGALPAIALDGHPALSTAYMNDCEPLLCFAQQINGYGTEGDVFLRYIFNNKSKVMVLITSGISIVAMMLVKSSTATIVAILVSVGVFYLTYKKQTNLNMNSYGILVIYGCITVLILLGSTSLLKPFVEGVLHKDMTFTGRSTAWERVLLLIASKPVFGWGVIDSETATRLLKSIAFVNPHNQLLNCLWQGGIILVFILSLIMTTTAFNIAKTPNRPERTGIQFVWIGLLIDMIFEVLLGTGATWICLLLINHLYEFIYEREGS